RWGERPHFVILTMYNDEAYLRKALEFGAIGYLLKDNAESELIACLEAVQYGCHYISPSISGALACYNNKEGKYLERLTATERKIYLLISEYKSNAAIAVLLALSIRTVENHRSNICKKLNLKGYNALIKFASENH
ncbi:MAG: response regulator transcription factor, partial [Methyloprofundus sp.]|nr:response regulator transcription factor [Methyloprofundus sp.]